MRSLIGKGNALKYNSNPTRQISLNMFLGGGDIREMNQRIVTTDMEGPYDLTRRLKSNLIKSADLPSTCSAIPFIYD